MTYDEHKALIETALKVGGIDQTIGMVAGVLAHRDVEIERFRRLLDHPAIIPTGINWRNADNNETKR